MPEFKYKTNGEEVKCVNCGNTAFIKHEAVANGRNGRLVPFECERCHFVAWFPEDYAPEPAHKDN